MFGDILFVSDDINAYNGEQIEILLRAYSKFNGKIRNVNYTEDGYSIDYSENGDNKKLEFSMKTGDFTDFNNGSDK